MSSQTQQLTFYRKLKQTSRVFSESLRLISRNKAGLVGFIVLTSLILSVTIGPLFVPLDTKTHINQIYVAPSWQHLLGTDNEGKDIFSQVIHGGKQVIYIATLAALIAVFIAVFLGSLSGFIGGKVDSLLMRITDVALTFPHFPLLAVLSGFINLSSPSLLAGALAIVSWPWLTRTIRSIVLSLRERDYMEAAKALDLGTGHIIFSEMMPTMMSYIIINFIFTLIIAIYNQVGLIMLGFIPMASNNWGVMIFNAWSSGAIFYKQSMYYILAPITAIAVLQLSLVTFSRSLEEVFNPRLRGGG